MPNTTQPNQSSSQTRASRSRLSAVGPALRRLTSVSGIRATAKFFRRQLWAWPVLAAVILGVSGWLVDRSVERAMRARREAELKTVLNAEVESLRTWMSDQGRNADLLSQDEKLHEPIRALLATPPDAGRALLLAPAQAEVRDRLAPRLKALGYVGFFVVSPEGVVVASEQDAPVGKPLDGYRGEFFDRVRATGPSVSKPYRSPLLLQDETGAFRADLPTMFAAAPIRAGGGPPIAVLGVRIRPDHQFSRLLRVAQSGETGETYAFDRDGLLLSNSRFDADLKRIGLLADLPHSQSILTVHLRDPGVDLTAGQRPTALRGEQPMTRNAADAVAGNNGCDPDGYRDYRGVTVVGAWAWLPEYDIGVATEVDAAEAFEAVYVLRAAFRGLMALLAVAAVAIFIAMLVMARQQRSLQEAALQMKQLGQYALEEKIGAGGMGTVYKARHAMLRRPTAVKVLETGAMSDAAVARFEREVQITATLTHPNTIAVYDYGRTPEGLFYYAMEYLDGVNLEDLVARYGPLPEPRVTHILRQVCGSLAEAHAAGLIHRDVKPANVFLTARGGMHDFVKVLDFGLAKAVGGGDQAHLTATDAIAGTPLYLSPEAISRTESVDARSDVYAVGAVAYFLLTGTTVFRGGSVVEVCMKHVRESPEPPSARLGRALTPALEQIVLRCLAKEPSDRPVDAAALLQELDRVVLASRWAESDAASWWANQTSVFPTENQTIPQTADQFTPSKAERFSSPL